MMFYDGFLPYFFFGFGYLFMFLFWSLVICALFFVFWRAGGSHGSHALDIAKERYAKGELNKEDFETIKTDLA